MNLYPSTPLFPIPSEVSVARIQHAYVNMNTDAANPARGASIKDFQSPVRKRTATTTFIDSLWDAPSNHDLVSSFLNNKFVLTCAYSSDAECLPLYQKYSVQDYFYLEDYVKFKALRLNTIPAGDLNTTKSEAESLSKDAKFTIEFAESYVNDLYGKKNDLVESNRNIPELAYANVLQRSATREDWFNLHAIMIPCVYGWGVIARNLLSDPMTKNDTIFYNTWIEPNSPVKYGNDLSRFLDANVAQWKSENDKDNGNRTGKWTSLFRTALKLEIAMFESALEK